MHEISLAASVAVPEEVVLRHVSGEAVLLNLKNEHYYGLDEVGTRIWMALNDEPSIQASIDVLLDEYDVTFQTLQQDVLELVGKLVEHGLLELNKK